jgi:acetyl-CoA C-acetyltransferase
MIALLLASEETARRLTARPVWINGYGCSMDSSAFGDRDLLRGELQRAAERAYRMAGITDPRKEIELAEITEPYAFQELMWYEGLGLCPEGQAARLIESGATRMDGPIPVNPSGGVLSTNPYVSRGLQRVAEATLQIRGEAGERQVPKRVGTALAHGVHGFAGQCHVVVVLGR